MKADVYIAALYDSHGKDYTYHVFSYPPHEPFVNIEKLQVEFTPPPFDVLQSKTVEAYRAEQQKIRAEAQSKVAKLQEAIDSMLCLEYKGEA